MSKRQLPTYVDAATCTACGGACCKRAPGITSPEDWGAPHRLVMRMRLVEAFRSKNYAIDWWEKDLRLPKTLFVRPATTYGRTLGNPLRHPSSSGTCVLLTEKGCSLEHDARPFECRELEPNPQYLALENRKPCVPHVERVDIVKLWREYQDVIEAAEAQARAA